MNVVTYWCKVCTVTQTGSYVTWLVCVYTDNWSILNILVRQQELPPRYTWSLHQTLVEREEKAPLGPSLVPRLVVSLKRTCLKQQPRVHSEKKAPCERRCSWPSRASSLPFNRAAADKFTSPTLTRGLTFQTRYWQENSRRREGWREEERDEKKSTEEEKKQDMYTMCFFLSANNKQASFSLIHFRTFSDLIYFYTPSRRKICGNKEFHTNFSDFTLCFPSSIHHFL